MTADVEAYNAFVEFSHSEKGKELLALIQKHEGNYLVYAVSGNRTIVELMTELYNALNHVYDNEMYAVLLAVLREDGDFDLMLLSMPDPEVPDYVHRVTRIR
ncbi:MAG TPA: hypothetical protein VHK27_14610 [Gammaproteobacteria bacterium]|nr:hypothetical protein [Gammaproteobacteria bacterium]